jgi:hypothetical protein
MSYPLADDAETEMVKEEKSNYKYVKYVERNGSVGSRRAVLP